MLPELLICSDEKTNGLITFHDTKGGGALKDAAKSPNTAQLQT